MRPIHFMVVLWGDRYREHYFINHHLPSMMKPDNFPLLDAKDGHRFFIACPRRDYFALVAHPIVHELTRHVTLQWVEIAPFTKVDDARRLAAVEYQNLCLPVVMQRAHAPGAYGCLQSPDGVYCNGFIKTLLHHIEQGCELLLLPALRQTEEDCLANMQPRTPYNIAAMAADYLHPEVEPFVEPMDVTITHAPFRIWRMPYGGILVHTFWGLPVLMDYNAVESYHPDNNNVDVTLRTANYLKCRKVSIIEDHEAAFLSLTPRDGKNLPTFENPQSAGYLRTLLHIAIARKYFLTDHIRRTTFAKPILIGCHNRNAVWRREYRRIERMMFLAKFIPVIELSPSWRWRWEIFKRLLKAAAGSRAARAWVIKQCRTS